MSVYSTVLDNQRITFTVNNVAGGLSGSIIFNPEINVVSGSVTLQDYQTDRGIGSLPPSFPAPDTVKYFVANNAKPATIVGNGVPGGGRDPASGGQAVTLGVLAGQDATYQTGYS
jgi:hypothetical protein